MIGIDYWDKYILLEYALHYFHKLRTDLRLRLEEKISAAGMISDAGLDFK